MPAIAAPSSLAAIEDSVATLWSDPEFLRLSAARPSAQLIDLYLRSGPYTRPVPGLARASREQIARGLTWPMDVVDRMLDVLRRHDGLLEDAREDLFWLPTDLTPRSYREWRAWEREVHALPHESLVRDALQEAMGAARGILPMFQAEQAHFELSPSPAATVSKPAATKEKAPLSGPQPGDDPKADIAFLRFWRAYPVKLDKQRAWRKWLKEDLASDLPKILRDLAARGHDTGLGRPLSYLRYRMWERIEGVDDVPLRADGTPTLFDELPEAETDESKATETAPPWAANGVPQPASEAPESAKNDTPESTESSPSGSDLDFDELARMSRLLEDLGHLHVPLTHNLLLFWHQEKRMDARLLKDAVWRARAARPTGRLSLNYLNPIINQILEEIEEGRYVPAEEAARVAGTADEIRPRRGSRGPRRANGVAPESSGGRNRDRPSRQKKMSIPRKAGQFDDLVNKNYYEGMQELGVYDDATYMEYRKRQRKIMDEKIARAKALSAEKAAAKRNDRGGHG